METRTATDADLDALARLFDLYRVFYGQASDLTAARAFLAERLQRGESHLICAVEQERIVGFTQLYPSFSSVSMQAIWTLNDLFVDPDYRRGGAGRQLLVAARDHARQTGAIRLELSTGKDNTTAQSLYEANGWLRDDEYYYYSLSAETKL